MYSINDNQWHNKCRVKWIVEALSVSSLKGEKQNGDLGSEISFRGFE